MTSPAQRTASRSFALAVGAIIAVVAVVILIVRAGDAAHSDVPAGPPLTTIDIVSDPVGATVVRADGGLLGVAPFTASLPKGDGELAVLVMLDGYQTRHLSVPLFSATGRIDVKLTRDGEDAAVPPSPPDHWIP